VSGISLLIGTSRVTELAARIDFKMMHQLKNVLRSSVTLYCVSVIAFDFMQGVALGLGFNRRHVGTLTGGSPADVDATVLRIKDTVDSYMRGSGVSSLRGSVAEVGPGDNLGVALMLLDKGAEIVHAIDRFDGLRGQNEQSAIYRRLASSGRLNQYLDESNSVISLRGVTYQCGRSAEDYFRETSTEYDCIFSFSVLEHVINPILCLSLMQRSLSSSGVMVHVVDFSDHKMLGDVHPLKFLTIPGAIYRRMVRNGARPNRIMLHEYKKWIRQSQLESEILVRRLVDGTILETAAAWNDIDDQIRRRAVERVVELRPRLAAEFADAPDEDLAVLEAIISIRSRSG
jgi:hypothetical protein